MQHPPPKHLKDQFNSGAPRPKLHFDWQDWLPYLAEFDATDDLKRIYIETVWSIVMSFVDAGWEIGPTLDAAAEISGKDVDLTTLLMASVVPSGTRQDQLSDRRLSPGSDGTEDAA